MGLERNRQLYIDQAHAFYTQLSFYITEVPCEFITHKQDNNITRSIYIH